MAYFADLSPYTYIRGLVNQKVLNVGWLSHGHKFREGTVPEEVLAKIFVLCKSPVNQTQGLHSCEFCPSSQFGQPVERDGVQLRLGSAEIRVPSRSGVEYACPDMIYHYMKDHSYKPPQEFVDAFRELNI
jgi:hypothetical protein